MDIKKDSQGNGSLSTSLTSGMESFNVLLSRKCERLATALYLVTNFLLDTEPIKSRLRTLSLELVREATSARYGATHNEGSVLENLRGNINETLSLLELSFIVGLVSEMNFSILKREYTSLRDRIDVKKASRESRTDTILGDTFFGSSFAEVSIGHPSKGQRDIKDIQMSDRNRVATPTLSSFSAHKTQPRIPTQTSPKAYNPEAPLDIGRTARRTRILKLIKDNGEVTIKDISNHFPELSEKTVQRELVSLTEANILKKSGERRWSRYSLK
ncbi:MAG: DeoR family transcriptional regulator [Candidatus Pacebacteria bacterium]|nr:DeoR family transcriptional regulator [Candidatus Paceibacterota bacterium]